MVLDTGIGPALKGCPHDEPLQKPFIFNMFHEFHEPTRSVETGEIPGDPRNSGYSGYPHLWRNLWITSGWPQKRVSASHATKPAFGFQRVSPWDGLWISCSEGAPYESHGSSERPGSLGRGAGSHSRPDQPAELRGLVPPPDAGNGRGEPRPDPPPEPVLQGMVRGALPGAPAVGARGPALQQGRNPAGLAGKGRSSRPPRAKRNRASDGRPAVLEMPAHS